MKKNQLAKKLLRPKAVYPLAEMMPDLEQWFQTAAGQKMLRQQQMLLDELLPTQFGYHLMQMSVSRDVCLYRSSKIRHCFAVGPLAGGGIGSVCDEQLALDNESIDVAILHHVMEYTQQPHQLLREVSRVMVCGGQLVILSINPFSLMGAASLLHRMRGWGVWQNHLIGIRRLADWLTFMDFTVQSVQYGYYQLPSGGPMTQSLASLEQMLNRWQLPFGGFFMVVARKDVSRLTPVKSRRRLQARSLLPLMEPSYYYGRKSNKKTRLH